MFRRFSQWLFGAELKELENKIEKLEAQLRDHEETLYHFVKIEQENSNFKKIVGHAVQNLDNSLEQLGQLSIANHKRLLTIEEASKFFETSNDDNSVIN